MYHSLSRLFSAVVVVGIRSLLMWFIKSHNFDLAVFCLLLYLQLNPRSHWQFQANLSAAYRFPLWFGIKPEQFCYIRPWKFPKIHTEIFGRIESALPISLKKATIFSK